jgi:hypothetical protein
VDLRDSSCLGAENPRGEGLRLLWCDRATTSQSRLSCRKLPTAHPKSFYQCAQGAARYQEPSAAQETLRLDRAQPPSRARLRRSSEMGEAVDRRGVQRPALSGHQPCGSVWSLSHFAGSSLPAEVGTVYLLGENTLRAFNGARGVQDLRSLRRENAVRFTGHSSCKSSISSTCRANNRESFSGSWPEVTEASRRN